MYWWDFLCFKHFLILNVSSARSKHSDEINLGIIFSVLEGKIWLCGTGSLYWEVKVPTPQQNPPACLHFSLWLIKVTDLTHRPGPVVPGPDVRAVLTELIVSWDTGKDAVWGQVGRVMTGPPLLLQPNSCALHFIC